MRKAPSFKGLPRLRRYNPGSHQPLIRGSQLIHLAGLSATKLIKSIDYVLHRREP
jgi:hypothetical protein